MLSDKNVKVLCFTNEATVKGLEWAFDQKVYSDRSYSFFAASLSKPPESLADFDVFVLTLDLGQPVPLENIRKLPARPGVCGFLQPTPQQLLTIAEVPDWSPVAWDGVSFERLALRLDTMAAREQERSRLEGFLEGTRLWLAHHLATPAFLEWMNPPDDWQGARQARFDSARKSLSVGSETSKCDLRLPLATKGAKEICDFRLHEGVWRLRSHDATDGADFVGNPNAVRPGDQIDVGGHVLRVRVAKEVEDYLGLAKKSGFQGNVSASRPLDPDRTLAEVCKEFLASWTTGELRVSSGLRHGSVYFRDGVVHHAVAGSVSGEKALLRMLGWPSPTWRFNPEKRSELTQRDMDMDFARFTGVHKEWKERWAKLQGFLPPQQMRLRGLAKTFVKRGAWTTADYRVIAAVCEYQLVRDIFNNCPLMDVEILSSLVELRKQGLIEPLPTATPARS